MQIGKPARQHNVRAWHTLAPGLRVWIVEAYQSGILIKLHPESYRHTVAVTIRLALGNLEVDRGDVVPAVRIRAGGDEGLNLSWTDRSGAGIVDSTVGCGKWIRSAVPISCEGQVSGLSEGKHNVSDILE